MTRHLSRQKIEWRRKAQKKFYLYLIYIKYACTEMDETSKKAFIKAVYDVARVVPYGRATSYGAIAKAIGYPNMSRLVGRVMSECNSTETSVPAYRVVNSQGILSAGNIFVSQQKLLEAEGITITNNRIKNWKIIFWDPMSEIQI